MIQVKQHIITIVAAFVAIVGLMVLPAAGVSALNPSDQVNKGVNAAGGTGQQLEPQIAQIINVLLFVIGAIAVIMIILGGIRYVLSNGDSAQITSAKNTVLYSVIGLVVALLAYAIVNFVVAQFA
jgi:hypothetical protein